MILIFLNTNLMGIIILRKVNVFSRGKKIIRINFGFCIIMRKIICNTTFLTYKISNSIVNGIIFSGPINTKYLVPL